MSNFIAKDFDQLVGENPANKYYVYRLVDPRNMQTFYVGKGSGDRVYQHAKNAKIEKGQNEKSEKIELIREILSEGKEVICIIHRWGLSNKTAYEVEAALIDAYPGLTNKIGGHHGYRGIVMADDLLYSLTVKEYDENSIPQEVEYLIIKTSYSVVHNSGSLYEATRKAWKRSLRSVKRYKYVLSVINSVVKEVYEVEKDEWHISSVGIDRVEFDNNGRIANDPKWRALIGKKIPAVYRMKGMSNPVIGRKKNIKSK